MIDRITRTVLVAVASVIAAAAIGLAAAAPASAASARAAGAYIRCSTWIDGSVGRAQCYNYGDLFGMARLRVNCLAWYDPNVTTEWQGIDPGGPISFEGTCWSAPTAVWIETK
jgi:hypothetical protein